MAVSKAKSSANKATHPKYNEMITAAIEALKEKGRSSRLAILKYISGKYKVIDNPNIVNSQLKIALKRGVAAGSLNQVKGTGASGSFKLKAAAKSEKATKKPVKKMFKSKATKSPKKLKAKKDAVKKTVKSPRKVATPKPNKAATKKSKKVAKAAAKKSAIKTAKPKVKNSTKKPAKK